MNTALIMIGSNLDAEQNLDLVKEKLSEHFEIISESTILKTKAVGKKYKADFLNVALALLSDETADETKDIFKQLEKEMGRTPDSKKEGLIPIDIDLIFWNDTQLHEDYNRFPFVTKCIDEIKD